MRARRGLRRFSAIFHSHIIRFFRIRGRIFAIFPAKIFHPTKVNLSRKMASFSPAGPTTPPHGHHRNCWFRCADVHLCAPVTKRRRGLGGKNRFCGIFSFHSRKVNKFVYNISYYGVVFFRPSTGAEGAEFYINNVVTWREFTF